MESRHFDKQRPPDGMLYWRFLGWSNIIVVGNASWREHAKPIRNAISRSVSMYIPQFVALSQKLVGILCDADSKARDSSYDCAEGVYRVCWSDFARRFSLDAIGTTALGYDFDALGHPDSPFVAQYHRLMHDIANPLYVFLPGLEKMLPRKRVVRDIDELVDAFMGILRKKEMTPGNDIISYILEDPDMTTQERKDNMVVMFVAGHVSCLNSTEPVIHIDHSHSQDTTAGSLSVLVYCFAKYPECQRRAREEVFRALSDDTELNTENLSRLPYLQACIREGLRFHCPATTTMPRVAQVPVDVCGHTIPPDTPVVLNMYGVHHNPSVWRDSDTFDPERFLRRSDSAVEDASEATEEATEFEDDLENGWLPFGVGPRSCPARAFSLLEQKTLLAVLLREFEWSLPENSAHSDHIRVAFSVFSLNLPHNLDIIFTRLGKECTTMVEDFNN